MTADIKVRFCIPLYLSNLYGSEEGVNAYCAKKDEWCSGWLNTGLDKIVGAAQKRAPKHQAGRYEVRQ